jgi:hypothetical protein
MCQINNMTEFEGCLMHGRESQTETPCVIKEIAILIAATLPAAPFLRSWHEGKHFPLFPLQVGEVCAEIAAISLFHKDHLFSYEKKYSASIVVNNFHRKGLVLSQFQQSSRALRKNFGNVSDDEVAAQVPALHPRRKQNFRLQNSSMPQRVSLSKQH